MCFGALFSAGGSAASSVLKTVGGTVAKTALAIGAAKTADAIFNRKTTKINGTAATPEPLKVESAQDTLDTVSTKKTNKRTLSSLRINRNVNDTQASFMNTSGVNSTGLNIPQ